MPNTVANDSTRSNPSPQGRYATDSSGQQDFRSVGVSGFGVRLEKGSRVRSISFDECEK
jgi:hypothetical protein